MIRQAFLVHDSVLPIVEAKRAQIVKSDFALNEFDPVRSDPRPHDQPLPSGWSVGPGRTH